MSPSADAFDRWWNQTLREPGALDDAYRMARTLWARLDRVEQQDRQRCTERLMRVLLRERLAYGIVLFLLEGMTDPADLKTIHENLLPLPERQSDDEEGHLADLIRILAAADEPTLLPAVRDYLLEREIVPIWPSVPWALWPHQQSIFGQAWYRYFVEQDPSDWPATLVLRSFLGEPEAIRAFRQPLAQSAADRWTALRVALLSLAVNASWLSEDQRVALHQVLT